MNRHLVILSCLIAAPEVLASQASTYAGNAYTLARLYDLHLTSQVLLVSAGIESGARPPVELEYPKDWWALKDVSLEFGGLAKNQTLPTVCAKDSLLLAPEETPPEDIYPARSGKGSFKIPAQDSRHLVAVSMLGRYPKCVAVYSNTNLTRPLFERYVEFRRASDWKWGRPEVFDKQARALAKAMHSALSGSYDSAAMMVETMLVLPEQCQEPRRKPEFCKGNRFPEVCQKPIPESYSCKSNRSYLEAFFAVDDEELLAHLSNHRVDWRTRCYYAIDVLKRGRLPNPVELLAQHLHAGLSAGSPLSSKRLKPGQARKITTGRQRELDSMLERLPNDIGLQVADRLQSLAQGEQAILTRTAARNLRARQKLRQ